jgi:outer membrane protein OmpA-like peptidoglycan-associated protein
LATWIVGERARLVDTEDLKLTVEGEQVTDKDKVEKALRPRLDKAVAKVGETAVEEQGFALFAALQAAADEERAAGGPVEVWLSTTVFAGSVDPLTISMLTGTDPKQAVDELMKGSLGSLDLDGVRLHPVLMTPVGDGQRALSPASEAWRAVFITDLAERMHATVSEPVHDNTIKAAWPHSASVPVIEGVKPPPPPPTGDLRIDNAAFKPNIAELADPPAAEQVVNTVAAAYRQSLGRYRIEVTGYCARFGDAAGANQTSSDRANAIAAMLRDRGVPDADISARGVGFQDRADPEQDPYSAAQRVVVLRLVKKP